MFDTGRPNGAGVLTRPNGESWDGVFKYGLKQGKFLYCDQLGKKYNDVYVDDERTAHQAVSSD